MSDGAERCWCLGVQQSGAAIIAAVFLGCYPACNQRGKALGSWLERARVMSHIPQFSVEL